MNVSRYIWNPPSGFVKCLLCGEKFNSRSKTRDHIETEHDKEEEKAGQGDLGDFL